jgi:hypothetical protein
VNVDTRKKNFVFDEVISKNNLSLVFKNHFGEIREFKTAKDTMGLSKTDYGLAYINEFSLLLDLSFPCNIITVAAKGNGVFDCTLKPDERFGMINMKKGPSKHGVIEYSIMNPTSEKYKFIIFSTKPLLGEWYDHLEILVDGKVMN